MELINKYSKDAVTESHFAMYLKSIIKRYRGELNESLDVLRKCYSYNENNLNIMKEIGKNLLLLGKFKMSIEIYDEILMRDENNWEAFHEKGVCSLNLRDYDMAHACFTKALSINNDETT